MVVVCACKVMIPIPQCRDGAGACPDVATSGRKCKNNVFNISGSRSNGVQCVTYSRPLSTSKLT